VNVQLIDARNDRHLWADVLRRNLGGAPSIQDELTEAIAHQVGVQLTPLEQQYFSGRHLIDPGVLSELSARALLLGQAHAGRARQGRRLFPGCRHSRPKNALAFAGLR